MLRAGHESRAIGGRGRNLLDEPRFMVEEVHGCPHLPSKHGLRAELLRPVSEIFSNGKSSGRSAGRTSSGPARSTVFDLSRMFQVVAAALLLDAIWAEAVFRILSLLAKSQPEAMSRLTPLEGLRALEGLVARYPKYSLASAPSKRRPARQNQGPALITDSTQNQREVEEI